MSSRIPHKVTLPFHYVITIAQLCNRGYDEECGNDSLACWMVEDRTIYLRKSRTIRKRRADLAHEFLHACADWQVWLIGSNQSDVKD